MNYNRLNNLVGWAVFIIATIVYFMTIESTASLWDCGEYITAANKLEVGHPPGAPLFMILGRLFSFFAAPEEVAVWINRLSALSSSFTILFMYWSITLLGKKIMRRLNNDWTKGDQIAVIGAGVIGALAYTFSDSFWFSAVEGEVYAMSSLFTAAIFWAILKWDEEWSGIKSGEIIQTANPWRWLILIAFLFGLAIGVHLLGLLVVPSIAFVIYFNLYDKVSVKGILLTGLIGVVTLGFIQEGLIPGIISIASSFEVGFVNSMNLPFFTGTIVFFILLIAAIVYGFRWASKKMKPMITTIIWSFVMLLIGYGSFAVIVIRSNANTPLDENDPENLATLYSYLKREQYGSWPILKGNYWNSLKEGEVMVNGQPELQSQEAWGDLSATYLRRFVVQKIGEDQDIKAFKSEADAKAWAKAKGPRFEVKEKYFCSNEKIRHHQVATYSQSTILPRMYYTSENPNDPKLVAYKNWSGYNPSEDKGTDVGRDGLRLPTFGENMKYMWNYQLDWMYWRYFMWNFAGRQNDIQGHGDAMRGNWKTGFDFLDSPRIGKADTQPYYTSNNPANNSFFLFPLILGILGLIYHIYRAPKDAFIVFLTFLFTGLAIVVYLNQKPFEPRERDYAYAASFYAFAMWIGFGVLALYDIYKNFKKEDWAGFGKVTLGLTGFVFILMIFSGATPMITYLFMLVVIALLIGLAFVLKKIIPNQAVAAFVLTLVGALAPYLMGQQGWDDHDRSGKTSARDLAENYLMSCAPNSIVFTVGDNDTFPLWYLQEVEGKHTDKRVCNTSLFDTDWYTDQMKMKAYQSEPLPIKFREDQILMFEGGTDQAYILSTYEMLASGANEDKMKMLLDLKIKNNKREFAQAYNSFRAAGAAAVATIKEKDGSMSAQVNSIKASFNVPLEGVTASSVIQMIRSAESVFQGYQSQALEADQNALSSLIQQLTEWENSWGYLPIDEAMEFVRDDENMITLRGNKLRAFPCKGFVVPVDKENALKSQIVDASEKNKIGKSIRFGMTVAGITKSDLMILDIIANNDWKRALYFSSPGGTEVGMALYRAGHLRQNGMTWEISPVKVDANEPLNADRMYDNLMNKYVYGKMNQADVLTDYYARRNTFTLRNSFSQLANYFLNQAQRERNYKENYGSIIKQLKASGQGAQADSLQQVIDGADARIAEYNKKAISLVKKSLEVMPADIVLDYGEQANKITSVTDNMGNELYVYGDGNLQTYVSILFRAGAKVEAEKLGAIVADQVESTINFFTKNDEKFAAENASDFSAAVGAYLEMYKAAKDGKFGNPSGAFFARLEQRITALYNSELTSIYSKLKIRATENEELPGSGGLYSGGLASLESSMYAAGVFYDYIIEQTEEKGNNAPSDIAMDSLNQPLVTDTTLPAGTPMDSQNSVKNASGM